MNSCSIQMIQGNTIELDDSNGPSGVRIGNLGNFNNSGIQVLLKYFSIAKFTTRLQRANGLAQCQS